MLEIIEKELINRYDIELKKRQGFWYNLMRLRKTISIFNIPNGIFHKNEIRFDSFVAHFGSILLYISISLFLYRKLLELDKIKSFNTYQIFKNYQQHQFKDIKILDQLPDNQKPFVDDKETGEILQDFPFYIFGYNIGCEDGVNFKA